MGICNYKYIKLKVMMNNEWLSKLEKLVAIVMIDVMIYFGGENQSQNLSNEALDLKLIRSLSPLPPSLEMRELPSMIFFAHSTSKSMSFCNTYNFSESVSHSLLPL